MARLIPGAWEKMAPAIWAPEIRLAKQMKSWNMVYSPLEIRFPPYQNAKAAHRKTMDCEAAYMADACRMDRTALSDCRERISL